MLGAEQKAVVPLAPEGVPRAVEDLGQLARDTVVARAIHRICPPGSPSWGGAGYASFGGSDWSTLHRRARRDLRRGSRARASPDSRSSRAIVTPSGPGCRRDRCRRSRSHPVGVEFVVGSISSPGVVEAAEHRLPTGVAAARHVSRDRCGRGEARTHDQHAHPARRSIGARVRALGRHRESPRALQSAICSPHVSFVDLGGHGYATVRVTPDALETEFVCIPRPIERSTAPDGGPLRYRVLHRARLWKKGERPRLEQRVLEGAPVLSI